jgi:hypothetical protein
MFHSEMPVFTKALIILTSLLVLSAGAAFGQAGYIGLYADPEGINCSVSDDGSGQVTAYVIHRAASGTTGSQWKIEASDGFDMTYVGESLSYVAMGNTQSGISMSYGSCLGSQILLCTITYVSNGSSSPCSYLQVVADPNSDSGAIEVMNCASQKNPGNGSRLYVNPDGSCACGQVNPIEETDWGRIKAMFADR